MSPSGRILAPPPSSQARYSFLRAENERPRVPFLPYRRRGDLGASGLIAPRERAGRRVRQARVLAGGDTAFHPPRMSAPQDPEAHLVLLA